MAKKWPLPCEENKERPGKRKRYPLAMSAYWRSEAELLAQNLSVDRVCTVSTTYFSVKSHLLHRVIFFPQSLLTQLLSADLLLHKQSETFTHGGEASSASPPQKKTDFFLKGLPNSLTSQLSQARLLHGIHKDGAEWVLKGHT